jgi:hypothetical protein
MSVYVQTSAHCDVVRARDTETYVSFWSTGKGDLDACAYRRERIEHSNCGFESHSERVRLLTRSVLML